MENLLNIIFPPKCVFCNSAGRIFCNSCLNETKILKEQRCIVCDTYSKNGITHERCLSKEVPLESISLFEYTGYVRECIRISKYSKKLFMCLKVLCEYGLANSKIPRTYYKGFCVVPIPVSKIKYKQRGFNHADIIAYCVGRYFGLKVISEVLMRGKDTKAQYEKSRKERFENLEGAFYVNKKLAQGKKILLVDDVCTTGATLLEASKVLSVEGAVDVKCFTLSRVL